MSWSMANLCNNALDKRKKALSPQKHCPAFDDMNGNLRTLIHHLCRHSMASFSSSSDIFLTMQDQYVKLGQCIENW